MIAYCDTSSLIKLYADEPGSEAVRTLLSEAGQITTSSVAYVEMRAALARLRRERRMTSTVFARVKHEFDADWEAMVVVRADADIVRAAANLAERHHLRALDAIHLASFVEILERRTDDDVYFSSFDEDLNRAARRLK
jgi:hypothetical protein